MIPDHLQHLPTWRRLPVPTVALWSGELPEEAWDWGHDPTVDRDAWFPCGEAGAGAPLLGRMHPARQRASAVGVRCQVCDAQLAEGVDAWLVVSEASTLRRVVVDGRAGTSTVVIEPWVCPPCLAFALQVCPGLVGRQRDEDLVVHRPRRHLAIMSTAVMTTHPQLAEAEVVQPALWVKLAVSDGVTLAADEFLALRQE